MIFIIIWFDIASEEIELNANPFNLFLCQRVAKASKESINIGSTKSLFNVICLHRRRFKMPIFYKST